MDVEKTKPTATWTIAVIIKLYALNLAEFSCIAPVAGKTSHTQTAE
jgi:hypothetical protein